MRHRSEERPNPTSKRGARHLAGLVVGAMLAALLGTVPASISPAATANSFTDVPGGAFYSSAVDWLAGEGIATGTTATTFSPDEVATRAQMATFLERFSMPSSRTPRR